MTLDILLGVVGVFGFLLAAFLAVVELRRYWLGLQLKIQCYKVEYFDNQESVVLFRLSFVNQASAGKTVNKTAYTKALVYQNNVGYNKPLGIIWREPEGVYDINNQSVNFSLPNGIRQMPYFEMLQYPLDIPPHQSCTRWHYLIANLENIPRGAFPLTLQAFDVFGNLLDADTINIPIDNLKKLGIYYTL